MCRRGRPAGRAWSGALFCLTTREGFTPHVGNTECAARTDLEADTYTPLTPRVPVGPDGPRAMTRSDVDNIVQLDGTELVRYTLLAKGGAA